MELSRKPEYCGHRTRRGNSGYCPRDTPDNERGWCGLMTVKLMPLCPAPLGSITYAVLGGSVQMLLEIAIIKKDEPLLVLFELFGQLSFG